MIIKRMTVLLTLFFLLEGCSAKTPLGPPKPQFDAAEFNFGRIPEGVIVTHIYDLTNEGGDSLVITELRPHCGCTKAPLATSVVGAGKTVPIELRFNSRGYHGKARKSASIRLDADGKIISDQLFFSAYIDTSAETFSDGQIAVSEPVITFADSVERVELQLSNRMAASRELSIVDYQPDRIELSWKKKLLGPKESATLEITRKIPANELYASITMEMKGYDNSRITIPLGGVNRKVERIRSVRKIAPRK